MNFQLPVVAVVGAGAVGSYYGGRLARHGLTVHFLLRSSYDDVRRRGLIVKSCDGDFSLRPEEVNAHRDVSRMPRADLVIVTLKTTANHLYEPLIGPLLKDDTLILTLQNGLGNEERLAKLFGAGRVLGGLAFVCINRLRDNVIHHIDQGQISVGEFVGGPQPRTRRVADLFIVAGVRCKVLDDLRYGRWEKLVWNIPFNGLGAVLNKTTDRLIATNEGVALVKSLMEEVIATASAQGIRLEPNLAERMVVSTRGIGAYRTSMQVDKEEGRPLEVEAILQRPLATAESAGLSVPCLHMLCRMAGLP